MSRGGRARPTGLVLQHNAWVSEESQPAKDHRPILNGILWIIRTGWSLARLASAHWPLANRVQRFPALANWSGQLSGNKLTELVADLLN